MVTDKCYGPTKVRLYIMWIWSIEMITIVNIEVTNRHLGLWRRSVTFGTDSATGSSQILCGASCMALALQWPCWWCYLLLKLSNLHLSSTRILAIWRLSNALVKWALVGTMVERSPINLKVKGANPDWLRRPIKIIWFDWSRGQELADEVLQVETVIIRVKICQTFMPCGQVKNLSLYK